MGEWIGKLCYIHTVECYFCLFFVQSLSCIWVFVTPWTAAHQVSLSLTEFARVHVHCISDAIQTSHPLSPSPPFAFNLSQPQVAKILELQHQSFQWVFRVDFLLDWLVWSWSPRDSQESSPVPQFKSINSPVLSFLYSPNSHPYMTTGKTSFD